MSFLATTAEVLTGATVAPVPALLLAPLTLAYAIALPAMNRITPIITNISVCLFTEDFPLSTDGQLEPPVSGLLPPSLRWRVRRASG
jgi:hypothetical protein